MRLHRLAGRTNCRQKLRRVTRVRGCRPKQTGVGLSTVYRAGALTPSPIVELNRAVAVSMASGPEEALSLLEPLMEDPLMKDYHLLPSVRGDLLARLGRDAEAAPEFERAAAMTRNEREKKFLLDRARKCAQEGTPR